MHGAIYHAQSWLNMTYIYIYIWFKTELNLEIVLVAVTIIPLYGWELEATN